MAYNDPLGLYGKDVHFYMTYYLARECGLSADDAEKIAWADQYTDVHPDTLATDKATGLDKRERYHFRVSPLADKVDEMLNRGITIQSGQMVAVVIRNSTAAKAPLEKGINTKSMYGFAVGLHAYQDSWSHESYEAGMGHLTDGHKPDWPFDRPDMALDMAKQTYESLGRWRAATSEAKGPIKPWENVKDDIDKLIRAADSEDEDKRCAVWQAAITAKYGAGITFVDPGKDSEKAAEFLKAAQAVTNP